MSKIKKIIRMIHWQSTIVGFVVGIFIAILVTLIASTNTSSYANNALEENKQLRTHGKYTSPLLECYGDKPLPVDILTTLENEIKNYIKSQKSASSISIYFRDLTNGGSFQIGDDNIYRPASLMKLPTAIAAYKKIDKDANFGIKRVAVTGESDIKQFIKSAPSVKVGENFTILELIDKTIIDSDNSAHAALVQETGSVAIEQVLEDFNIPLYTTVNEYAISPRIYASFFRILYNATYLSEASSEKLLSTLSKSTFRDGLRASIPENVEIAHKFGERTIDADDESNKVQLHDCGIVYTRRPYLICIMTKGSNYEDLYTVIKTLSMQVYKANVEE